MIGVHTRIELSTHLANLCIRNLIFVLLSGRASIVLNRTPRLPITEHSLMHRWIGRIYLIKGLVHTILQVFEHTKLQAVELFVH